MPIQAVAVMLRDLRSQMRVLRSTPDRGGRGDALQSAESSYDEWLGVAADMLEVPCPRARAGSLEWRREVEIGLAAAGLALR